MEDIKKIHPALLSIISIIVFAISFLGAPYIFAESTFDFLLSSGDKSVEQGDLVSNIITTTLKSGTPAPVSFNVSGLPPNSTVSFSPASCTPPCAPVITISTDPSTPAGVYPITIIGISNALAPSNAQGTWNLISGSSFNGDGICRYEFSCDDILNSPVEPEYNGTSKSVIRNGVSCSNIGANSTCIYSYFETPCGGGSGENKGVSIGSMGYKRVYKCVAN